ncbi:PQQ-like beta-propeller repeat protein [Micromonospora echinofusca]|uniref:PQQ-like beta-propeller repeat protein n=1 Tax=Micromonospora echinofusca TaxID=47858 RepID=UPI001FCA9511|nr:PQQ-like beta-propeller repeat protein [Micromonospora echinofusca]
MTGHEHRWRPAESRRTTTRRDPPSRTRRRAGAVAVVAATTSVLAALPATPASAVNAVHPTVVSADPANWTPHALDGTVYRILQIGNRVYMAGSFTSVRNANSSTPLAMARLVAFDATTGRIDTTFRVTLNGTVRALAASADGRSLYVGGSFTTVNGATSRYVTRVDAATGARVSGFVPAALNGAVIDVRLVGDRLILGGAFQTVAGVSRKGLAALNATTGAADGTVNLNLAGPRTTNSGATAPVKVEALDVSADGRRLIVIGNFSSVAGQARHQLAVIDLTTTGATLSAWATTRYQPTCANGTPTYMRGVDISADGAWFVVVTAGYTYTNTLCDAAARFEFGTAGPNKQPTWVNYTGGDTLLSVAVTGAAVYVGGHQRWLDNPLGRNAAGPGAVSRPGIGAIHPTTGKALSWNPTKERGVGTADILATPTGLWIGSDTSTVAGEFHGKIAFFPLA